MPALVAGIHVFLAGFHLKAWMGDKPGHDAEQMVLCVATDCHNILA